MIEAEEFDVQWSFEHSDYIWVDKNHIVKILESDTCIEHGIEQALYHGIILINDTYIK